MSTGQKRGRGRPKAAPGEALLEPIMIRLPNEMVRRIEAIQAARMDQPTKSTVIRELLARALDSGGER